MQLFIRSKRLTIFVIGLLLIGILPVTQADQHAEAQPTVLVLGDSLSAGFGMDIDQTWVAMLETRLQSEGYGYRVINASISGDTTGNGRRRLPRALSLHQPEIVIIELGGNDGLRGLPVEVMRNNLEDIVTKASATNALVVLAGILIPPNYGEDYASEFAAVYPALAEKYRLPLIPFFMEGVALAPDKMQADGIHPNVDAQLILMNNVWQVLLPALQERLSTS
jgi:acyl-CoA thioesterase-1